ncbi:unnamed protein product [Closterium sp. Yama58-4]|nr:unnamed protein product [Closterium sp. Yama58-4]
MEQEACPALDEPTASVSTLNLERVRQIKSRPLPSPLSPLSHCFPLTSIHRLIAQTTRVEQEAYPAALDELTASVSTLNLERTTRVEQEAYPALDELTASVSTLNLERVRQIKSRLVVISGRVQKVGSSKAAVKVGM